MTKGGGAPPPASKENAMSTYSKERAGTTPPSGSRPANGVKGPKKDSMKIKPSFSTGLPGKSGPNRSAGVPEAKIYADREGL